jgi:hypothetical protein
MRTFYCVLLLLALHIECTLCFSADFGVFRAIFGKKNPESFDKSTGKSRESFLNVFKAQILVKPAWIVDSFSFNESAAVVDETLSKHGELEQEPPFSSGFVPLMRAVFPKKQEKLIPAAEYEVELVDSDYPPSSSTCTLSRYSRGFIPLLRDWFRR